MNKAELINEVAETSDISKSLASQVVSDLFDIIAKALGENDQVAITGFGTFSVKDRAARTGRNPKTGEPIEISASRVPNFKAGKALKELVSATETI